jgi:hypothetical protein
MTFPFSFWNNHSISLSAPPTPTIGSSGLTTFNCISNTIGLASMKVYFSADDTSYSEIITWAVTSDFDINSEGNGLGFYKVKTTGDDVIYSGDSDFSNSLEFVPQTVGDFFSFTVGTLTIDGFEYVASDPMPELTPSLVQYEGPPGLPTFNVLQSYGAAGIEILNATISLNNITSNFPAASNFSFSNCSFTSLTATWPSTLQAVYIVEGLSSSDDVDNILISLYGSDIENGYVDLGQNPQPSNNDPGNDGETYADLLLARGWTVVLHLESPRGPNVWLDYYDSEDEKVNFNFYANDSVINPATVVEWRKESGDSGQISLPLLEELSISQPLSTSETYHFLNRNVEGYGSEEADGILVET